MRNVITLLLITFSSLAFGQSLQNTEWELYLSGSYEVNLRFETDTLYIGEGADLMVFSHFTESVDTITIVDIDYNGCPGEIVGTYLFHIENDTLSFAIVEDTCDFRAETLVGGIFVKAISSNVAEQEADSKVVLYPNPLQNGILNFRSDEKLDQITIYDAYGRLLLSTDHVSSIDLSSYATPLFFVELTKGGETTVRKVAKQ